MRTHAFTSRHAAVLRLRQPATFLRPVLAVVGLGLFGSAPALRAQTALPTVSAMAVKSSVEDLNDSPGTIVLNLSSPATANLKIAYSLKGDAVEGTDYMVLPGKVRVKPGKSSATIDITPIYHETSSPLPAKTVKLVVKAGNGYTVAAPASAKVKIISVILLP